MLLFRCLILIQDGSHYMVYTPSDPLLFVAAKVSLIFLVVYCEFYAKL